MEKYTENKNRILSFEEFSAAYYDGIIPRFNNFYLHFVDIGDPVYGSFRDSEYFKKIKEEYPELEQRLTKIFTEARLNKNVSMKEILKNIFLIYMMHIK